MIDITGDRVSAEDKVNAARNKVTAEQNQVCIYEAAAKQLEEEYEVCSKYSLHPTFDELVSFGSSKRITTAMAIKLTVLVPSQTLIAKSSL